MPTPPTATTTARPSLSISPELGRSAQTRGVVACTIDSHPRFHLEALRWFTSATKVADIEPSDLVVNVIGQGPRDVIGRLERSGVRVRTIEPFDERSPHCNKISGALAMSREVTGGTCVLTDADVAILEDPRSVALPPGHVGMKPVDVANPPVEVLGGVFARAGVAEPELVTVPWQNGAATFAGNGNGGLYLVPAQMLAELSYAWSRWALWLLDRIHLLGEWSVHVDQVSMALALADSGIGVHSLEPQWNMPIHIEGLVPADASAPSVIHYHSRIDHIGLIRTTGNAGVDEGISRVNTAVAAAWKEEFPNTTFWEWRYLTNPELGSGVGSRGERLEAKRRLITRVVRAIEPSSVLDVGCGDGEATRGIALPGYLGLDLSTESIARASASRPEGRYRLGSLEENPSEADLVFCLDVLIHQSDPAVYRSLVGTLVESARSALVVSGYDRPFSATSPMIFFHEPLARTLEGCGAGLEVYPLCEEHEVTTFLVLKPPNVRHPRDFDAASLREVIAQHPNPLRLADIRTSARRTVGFYPDHAPRLWEYPVVADLVDKLAAPGASVIDVGSGVSPLAPYLAAGGYFVDTLDPSPNTRAWPPTPDWNEWDFLDYGALGLARRSWNCTLEEVPPEHDYDVVYSVSVIEHLPASVRRSLLSEMRNRLRTSGLLVLTVDLVRGSDDLWNRSRGVEVEDPSVHGTFQSMVAETTGSGFDVLEAGAVRGLGDVPVDIGVVVAKRN